MIAVVLFLLLVLLPPGASARAEGKDGEKPPLQFLETDHSFGTVSRDSVLVHTFHFRNMADTTVRILSAASTCPCVQVDVPETEIAAGGEGCITVTYTGQNNKLGKFQQLVRVYTSATGKSINLHLFGTLQKNE